MIPIFIFSELHHRTERDAYRQTDTGIATSISGMIILVRIIIEKSTLYELTKHAIYHFLLDFLHVERLEG